MSPTCGACQEIAPVFAACAKEYPTKGVFLKVDILELKVSTYGVGVVPIIANIYRCLIN